MKVVDVNASYYHTSDQHNALSEVVKLIANLGDRLAVYVRYLLQDRSRATLDFMRERCLRFL